MAEKFDHLEEHLEKFVENIRQLGIIVSDFQPSSQAGLNQKLNFIVTGLQDIDKCRQQLHDITVPLEVFEYIDQGRNPQLYTKECLERALAKNEQVKGKIDTMKDPGAVVLGEDRFPGAPKALIELFAHSRSQSTRSLVASDCPLGFGTCGPREMSPPRAGKAQLLKFKSLLIQELSKVFPEDMAKYRSIRGEDQPPS